MELLNWHFEGGRNTAQMWRNERAIRRVQECETGLEGRQGEVA